AAGLSMCPKPLSASGALRTASSRLLRTCRCCEPASDVPPQPFRTFSDVAARVVRPVHSRKMKMRRRIAVLCMLAGFAAACREADGPADPSANDARIYLTSSPNGAAITIDGRETGQVTPDTVAVRRGDRTIELTLDSAGFTYDYAAIVEVSRTDTVIEVKLPLGLQCISQGC